MIEIHRLSKSFGDQQVLHDISATFHPGKVNFIIGRSGSGKTSACADAFGPREDWADAAKGKGGFVESIDVRVARFLALGFDEFVRRGQHGGR